MNKVDEFCKWLAEKQPNFKEISDMMVVFNKYLDFYSTHLHKLEQEKQELEFDKIIAGNFLK